MPKSKTDNAAGPLNPMAESSEASPFSRALTARLDAVEARCRELPQ